MGFPTLQKLTAAFKENDRVVFLTVQTVFEGYRTNTADKLRHNQLKYRLRVPMAHAPGDPDRRKIPDIMRAYRSGGTPWKVIIDPTGTVVYNAFHIDVDHACALIQQLLAAHPTSDP